MLTASRLIVVRPLRLRLAAGRLALAAFALDSRLLTAAPTPLLRRIGLLTIRLLVGLGRLGGGLARLWLRLLLVSRTALIQRRRRPA